MKQNKWKNYFYILASANLIILAIVAFIIFIPVQEEKMIEQKEDVLQGYVPFQIYSNKENLNKVINHYLLREANGGPIDYEVVLGQEVELYGIIPVFSRELQLKMTFEPKALENGDLILRQKDMSIGKMKLPVSYVLKFIGDNYRLPKGVIIQPDEKIVYISMQDLKLKSDIKVRVEKFDLRKNDITFQIYVPTK